MMQTIIKYVLLFFFYSAAGWLLESTYCSIGEKKLINRGFLTGPMCPIYGTAAIVLIVLIYNPFKDKPLLVFLLGIILCDVVEYITSFLMEKLFAARWWDYTYEFMNIKGRICLKHSLYWGVISVVFVKVIHPAVDRLYDEINGNYTIYIFAVIMVIFIIDVIYAVIKASDMRKLQLKLNSLIDTVSAYFTDVKESVEDKYETLKSSVERQSDKVADFKSQVEDIFAQFEERFKRFTKKEKHEKKNRTLSNRFFLNNTIFTNRTKVKLEKLKKAFDDIKAELSEDEDKQ